jgi:hypothetical protein
MREQDDRINENKRRKRHKSHVFNHLAMALIFFLSEVFWAVGADPITMLLFLDFYAHVEFIQFDRILAVSSSAKVNSVKTIGIG